MNYEDITLNDLVDRGRLSTRTANCCKAARLLSLANIVEYARLRNFKDLKGCGTKAQLELQRLVDEVDTDPESFSTDSGIPGLDVPLTKPIDLFVPEHLKERFQRVFDHTVADYFPEGEEVYRSIYPDVATLTHITGSSPNSMFIDVAALDFATLTRIWECTHAIFTQLELICIDANDPLNSHFSIRNREYKRNREFRCYTLAKSLMSQHHLTLVAAEYKRIMGSLSVRSRNVLTSLGVDEDSLVELLLSKGIERLNIRNCGRKSLDEIVTAFRKFPQFVTDMLSISTNELKLRNLNEIYPFLTLEQAQRYIEIESSTGFSPVFFLLYQFFLSRNKGDNGETMPERYYANFYGIGIEAADRNELGVIYGLTAERIRQILVGFTLDPLMQMAVAGMSLTHYPEYRENGLYVDTLSLLRRLKGDELRDAEMYGNNAMAGLVALTGDYTVVWREGMSFCVAKSLCEEFQFSKALIAVETLCSRRHEKEDLFDVDTWCARFAKPGKNVSEATRNCFVDMILSYLPMYEREGEIYIRQNYIRVAREAYTIIKEHGTPMSLADIFAAFKAKFPYHKFDDAESIRCHLHSSQGFRAIGKQSTYSLDIWDYNTETNTALIYRILSQSPVPLHSGEIVDRLKEYGRETTSMLVVNFIYMDKKRGFKRFRNSYFGVENRAYPPEYEELDPERPRVIAFEERLRNLEEFITANHYRPRSNNDPEEGSLYRWLDNVFNGKVNLTTEQRAQLDDFIATHSEDFITWTDYDFCKHCRLTTAFIADTGALPTLHTNAELARWLKRAQAEYSSGKMSPLRLQHFSEILSFIGK